MNYSLQDIATGGAAAVAVSTALTQVAKKLIELKWGPKDPAHDTLVEVSGLVVSVLVVVIAALSTTTAVAFSAAWWNVAVAALIAGVGIKYGASGLYKALTTGKVDALPALAEEVLQAFVPAPTTTSASAGSVTVLPPVVTPAPAVIVPEVADQIVSRVVAALTPTAFTPPPPIPVVPPPAPASPLIVPTGAGSAPVSVEAGTST